MEAPDFVHHARAETMLQDFARLRKAIRTDHDIEAADRALDKCERWFACINPNPKEHALNEEVERLRSALKRVGTPSAFYVATSNVDPEAYGRMVYAEIVLKGPDLHEAEAAAEAAVRSRFAPPLKEDT
ncbi:hypothetical protein VWZ88_12735 [Phaeobacter sp. JH20_36]|uniref:hypothetical protein n=1 Tax=unclassified Phaeobacter TaxID=2621772 RepID=UPI003A8AD73A